MNKATKKTLDLNLGKCESVTLKLPLFVMDFLRKTQRKPVEALEYAIAKYVKVEIEYMTPQDWAELLQPKNRFSNQEYVC